VIKSRRVRWARIVACMREVNNVRSGNLKGRDYLGDLYVGGRIILKLMFIYVGCERVEWTLASEYNSVVFFVSRRMKL
jgi:hypothetical protein